MEVIMNCIRLKSKNNEYHIILTFIKELKVFSSIEERKKFTRIMVDVMEKMDCKIYAQTIMLNHAHMIIKEGDEKKISSIVISICTRFAKFYNKLHNRKGKLFSRRYKSIPINDEIYFFRLFRYVHRNITNAGVLDNPWEYEWSSAKDYLYKKGDFFFPEVIERYESKFRYHPYTLEEFVGFEGDDKLIYYLNQVICRNDIITPPFTIEEFLNSSIDDRMVLNVDFKRYYDNEAENIYIKELNFAGIKNLKDHLIPREKAKVIMRLRQIGLTLHQLRKFSNMTALELKDAMYPSII